MCFSIHTYICIPWSTLCYYDLCSTTLPATHDKWFIHFRIVTYWKVDTSYQTTYASQIGGSLRQFYRHKRSFLSDCLSLRHAGMKLPNQLGAPFACRNKPNRLAKNCVLRVVYSHKKIAERPSERVVVAPASPASPIRPPILFQQQPQQNQFTTDQPTNSQDGPSNNATKSYGQAWPTKKARWRNAYAGIFRPRDPWVSRGLCHVRHWRRRYVVRNNASLWVLVVHFLNRMELLILFVLSFDYRNDRS